ncbi:MAG: insulinase family protein, partial [Tenericutes bacterium]|nr:insulinase family protein [Mycoplasmatota bacterium]
VLFNPNVDDEEFNKDFFNIIKKEIIAQTNAVKDNPNLFSSIKYSSIMYKDTPSAYSTYPTLEEIDKVTPKSLYNHYKKLFNGQYKINIVVLGEIDDSIEKIIDKKFSKMINSNEKLSFKINHKYSEKIVEKIDSLDYKQSKLYIGYRLNGLTYHEMYHVLNVYNTILGVMNDSILFNIVREKNSLCYSVGSYTSKDNPSLTIYAGINKNNYEKTKSLIIECVKNMSNKEYVEKLFDASKKTINTYLNNYYDEAYSQINYYYVNEFEDAEDIETLRKNINKVTIEEVCDLNKKISLSTIYLLKGDN